MKKTGPYLIILLFLFPCSFYNAQGYISNISISPAYPTITDTIYVYADLSFSNGSCELDYSNHSVVNNNIYANTHHCLGMLTVICSITDTFKLDPLPAGLYNFDLILNSGFGGPPCTPGIVSDDQDYMQFEVFDLTMINQNSENLDYNIYPNPSAGPLNIQFSDQFIKSKSIELFIYSAEGQLITNEMVIKEKELNLELPSGIFYIRFKFDQKILSPMKKLIIIK